MNKFFRLFAILLGMVALGSVPAQAAEYRNITLPSGVVIEYALVLPDGYQADKSYPLLLALPPDPQTRDMVNAGISFFEAQAKKRGMIVVSPVAPEGELYFRGGAILIPLFLDAIENEFNVGPKHHVAGISNGGISAFRVALDFPGRFQSLTAIPGFPHQAGLEKLVGLKVTMFVGELDTRWIPPMEKAANELKSFGGDVHFEIVAGAINFIRELAATENERLFDLIERGGE
jgi:predicted peptidase